MIVAQLLILISVPVCLAVRCYRCSSKHDPAVCGSDFKLTPQNTSHIVDNCDTCHKFLYKDTNEITRNCTFSGPTSFQISLGCKSETVNGHVVDRCSCSKELCNGARLSTFPGKLLLLLTSLVSINRIFVD